MENLLRTLLYGEAVADALGVPVEYKNRAWLKVHPVTGVQSHGTYNLPAGTWSDDTSMALCLAASLKEKGTLDPDDIMKRFAAWVKNGEYAIDNDCFDVGMSCMRAIDNYTLAGCNAENCGLKGERDNGNGSLMRIAPLLPYLISKYGVNFCGKKPAMQEIDTASSITHAHPISLTACGIYLSVAAQLHKGKSIYDSVKSGVSSALEYYDARQSYLNGTKVWDRIRDTDSLRLLPEDAIHSGGYVVDTLEAALWCLLTTASYEECVLKAINLGSDTDTTAAVAGPLAALAYGMESIPTEWMDALRGKDILNRYC